MTGINFDNMLPKCVGALLWYLLFKITDRHLEFSASGVNTASGMMD